MGLLVSLVHLREELFEDGPRELPVNQRAHLHDRSVAFFLVLVVEGLPNTVSVKQSIVHTTADTRYLKVQLAVEGLHLLHLIEVPLPIAFLLACE